MRMLPWTKSLSRVTGGGKLTCEKSASWCVAQPPSSTIKATMCVAFTERKLLSCAHCGHRISENVMGRQDFGSLIAQQRQLQRLVLRAGRSCQPRSSDKPQKPPAAVAAARPSCASTRKARLCATRARCGYSQTATLARSKTSYPISVPTSAGNSSIGTKSRAETKLERQTCPSAIL
jgi:hypothetical protein